MFPNESLESGKAFVAMDRLLDSARTGPVLLARHAVAEAVVDAIHFDESRGTYELHAFVIMSNHVHLLITPFVDPAKVMRCLKSYSAKRANEILGRTGLPFWQEESFDRLVRDRDEFEKARRYIEENPVNAGLVTVASDFPWSSAGQPGGRLRTGGPPHSWG